MAQELIEQIQAAALFLPAHGPITSFVYNNALQALEHLPFAEAVAVGASIFGSHPWLSEQRYRQECMRGRIGRGDLRAELIEDLGDRADELLGRLGTRFQLRLTMLDHPLPTGPTPELRWVMAETEALTRFQAELPVLIKNHLLSETRRWVMRDWSHELTARSADNMGIAFLRDSLQPFDAGQVERWSGEVWEQVCLQLTWNLCRLGARHAALPEESKRSVRHRDCLLEMTGEDSDYLVHRLLIPFCAAFLDQGLSAWPLPQREAGFLAAFIELYSKEWVAFGWRRELAKELARIQQKQRRPLELIRESLEQLGVEREEWPSYIRQTLLALKGYAGMIWQLETRSDRVARPIAPGSLIEFLAVRLVLDRLALRSIARNVVGWRGELAELRRTLMRPTSTTASNHQDQRAFTVFQLAQWRDWSPETLFHLTPREWRQLYTEVEAFGSVERRRIFHGAYERMYRRQALDALAAHVQRVQRNAPSGSQLSGVAGDESAVGSRGATNQETAGPTTASQAAQQSHSSPPAPSQTTTFPQTARHTHGHGSDGAANPGRRPAGDALGKRAPEAASGVSQAGVSQAGVSQAGVKRREERGVRSRPKFQLITCIDDREESLRRHLEEVEPACETFGFAGFFAVAMYYRGASDAFYTPLCPVIVKPQHYVRERVVYTFEKIEDRRRKQRRAIGSMSHQFHVGSRTFAGGVLTALLGSFATMPLVMRILFPRLTARLLNQLQGWVRTPPVTKLQLERTEPHVESSPQQPGYTTEEMTQVVARVLRDIGLTKNFARLVVICGHGSSSLNNPHESVYDCGACAGGRGGPNARAFAQMANHPEVRSGLTQLGLTIPRDTFFIGALHNTCNEGIVYYDLDRLPDSHRTDLDELTIALDTARKRNAHERARRFESAPLDLTTDAALRHVEGRSEDLSQARPEYGHATNALCLVGSRWWSRGLFLDRRAFLHSYDPAVDDEQATSLTRILQAVIPVCFGINLEYFFSYVDPQVYGSGTKLPHNIAALLGVMNGMASDLRPGLPWQGVEIHEPMRLLFVIQTAPETMLDIMRRNPAIDQLIRGNWIQLVLFNPEQGTLRHFHGGSFELYQPENAELPEAESSADWYRGWRGLLGCATIRASLQQLMHRSHETKMNQIMKNISAQPGNNQAEQTIRL